LIKEKNISLKNENNLNTLMQLTKEDKELIRKAKGMVDKKKIYSGELRAVGSALLTKNDKLFTGANWDLYCGVGFCAESSAISNMVSHSKDTEIKVIVASSKHHVMPPCGRCREVMALIDKKNLDNTWVIVSENEKVKLKELIPHDWR
jgi:cytidine deaminase